MILMRYRLSRLEEYVVLDELVEQYKLHHQKQLGMSTPADQMLELITKQYKFEYCPLVFSNSYKILAVQTHFTHRAARFINFQPSRFSRFQSPYYRNKKLMCSFGHSFSCY